MFHRKSDQSFNFVPHALVFSILLVFLFASSVAAREITLSWDPNNEPDLSHYVVYWGVASGDYSANSGNIGLTTEYSVEIPDDEQIYFFAVTAVDQSGLESDFSNEVNTGAQSISPSANAGPDLQVREGQQAILDGSQSIDPDGEIVSWHWVQTGGTPVELDDHTAVKPSFITPYVSPEGESLTFELTVTDSQGLKGTDFCVVNVIWVNDPPIASAGPDQSVNAGDPVVLDGSDSFDNDGYIASYNWVQTSGTTVILSDPTAMQPVFETPDVDNQGEILIFKLVVTDNQGLQSTSECLVNVNPESGIISFTSHWNLVSISNGSAVISIEDALAPIMDDIISVWAYDNGIWRVYDPINPEFTNLYEVESGQGLWINTRENIELTIPGATPLDAIYLDKGWNLVGFNSSTSQDIADAVSSIAENVISVWTYQDEQWEVYDPLNPGFSNLETMEQGHGYWINTRASCLWIP